MCHLKFIVIPFILPLAPAYSEYCSGSLSQASKAKIAEIVATAYREVRLETLEQARQGKRINQKQYNRILQNLETSSNLLKHEVQKGYQTRMLVQHEFKQALRLIKLEPLPSKHLHMSLCYHDQQDSGRCSVYAKKTSLPLQQYYADITGKSFTVKNVKMLGQYIAFILTSPLKMEHDPTLHVSIIKASFAHDLNQQLMDKLKFIIREKPLTLETAAITCTK